MGLESRLEMDLKKKSGISNLYIKFIMLFVAGIMFFMFSTVDKVHGEKRRFSVTAHDDSSFPLTGRHRTTLCSECHLKGVMKSTPTNCEECHWTRKQDDRYKLQLGYMCGDCHTTFGWKRLKPNSWNHLEKTGFLLEGVHKIMDCFACHKNHILGNEPGECIDCHREEYEKVTDPDHKTNLFSTDCKDCHKSMITWDMGNYPHDRYPLEGVHKTLECSECHKNGNYQGNSSECISCHQKDYDEVNDPNHKNAAFSINCTICHKSMLTWEGAIYCHTEFLLEGAHKRLDCIECHKGGVYSGLSSVCITCHLQDYNNTQNPNHKNSGYSTNCDECHLVTHLSWTQAIFNHQFPITSGKHSNMSCSDCHISSVYQEFSCIDCHEHQKNDMDKEHDDENGYSYNSQACYSCHPDGKD